MANGEWRMAGDDDLRPLQVNILAVRTAALDDAICKSVSDHVPGR